MKILFRLAYRHGGYLSGRKLIEDILEQIDPLPTSEYKVRDFINFSLFKSKDVWFTP